MELQHHNILVYGEVWFSKNENLDLRSLMSLQFVLKFVRTH